MKTCNEPGCNYNVFSRGYCKYHWGKYYGKSIRRQSDKGKEKAKLKKELLKEDEVFYMSIWRKRPHTCENCGRQLGNDPYNWMFHHVIPKSKRPELRHIEENIALLCLLCHSEVEGGKISDKMKQVIEQTKEKLL